METLAAPRTGLNKPQRFSGSLYRTSCEYCGTPFPPGPRRGKPRRWCDDACRRAAKAAWLDELEVGVRGVCGLLTDLIEKMAARREVRQGRS